MDGASPIIVASAVDQGYLPFALVIAASMARSTSGRRPVHYHVLYDGPEHWAAQRLATFRRRGVSVFVHRVTNRFAHLGSLNGIPATTFMRVQIPEVLMDQDRAIYLDCDAVVLDDLGALYDIDMGGRAIGATPCLLTVNAAINGGRTRCSGIWRPTAEYMADALGLVTREEQLAYFQCGVNVYDLRQMRETGFPDQMLTLAEAMRDRLAFCDQCGANRLLKGRVAPIDPRWNVAPFSLRRANEALLPPELLPLMRAQRQMPGIIHYGGRKPWNRPFVPGGWRWWLAAADSGMALRALRLHWRGWLKSLVHRDGLPGDGTYTLASMGAPFRLYYWRTRDCFRLRTSLMLQALQPRFPAAYDKAKSVFRAIKPLPLSRRRNDGT